MANIAKLLTEHIDIWTAADTEKKSGRGRANGNAGSVYGVKKLRELILDLAVRGKLVSQDPRDEPASELLKRIQAGKAKLIAEGKLKKEKPLAPIIEDKKPFELPKGWEYSKLGYIAQKLTDGSHNPPRDSGSGIPMLSSQNVNYGYIDFNNPSRYVTEDEFLEENSRTKIEAGDVLLTIVGTLGRAAVVQQDSPKFVLQRSVAAIKTGLLPRYLCLQFGSPFCIDYFEENGKGTAQKGIYLGQLAEMLITVPPLAEQHRIVANVDELMILCDQLEQQHSNAQEAHGKLVCQLLATLTQSQNVEEFNANWQRIYAHFDVLFTTEVSIEALKQTLLQLAVMGKLVPQDPNDEPAGQLIKSILANKDILIKNEGLKTAANEEIKQQEYYIQIPDSWAYCRLGNLAKFIDYRGKTPNKVASGIPLITAKNVRQGYISREPEEYITPQEYESWMTRGFPRVGDMLFTTEAPLGNIALIDISEKFALAQRVICFQLHNHAIGSFLKIALMSKQVQQQFEKEATGMTATGIKASKLKEVPIPIPPLNEQNRIVTKINDLMALCDQLKIRIQQANKKQQAIAEALVSQAVA